MAPAALHHADRGPQNPSDIGPGSPYRGGPLTVVPSTRRRVQ